MNVYTKEQAANYLGVSTKTIERWQLQFHRQGKQRQNIYRQDELDRAAKYYLGVKLNTGEKSEDVIEREKVENFIEEAYTNLKNILKVEILRKVKSCSPLFFEHLVVELLVKMGYGGTLEDAGQVIGKSHDSGIDGIIKEDRLGLDVIYLQAKRWEGVVGRPEIQKFAGALQERHARKGVFITTSNFTKEAKDFVKTISSNIILIGGEELAELMIDYNVGVSVATTYEIKRIDSDYFVEE